MLKLGIGFNRMQFFGWFLFLLTVIFFPTPALTQKIPGALILLPENGNAVIVEKKTQTIFCYSRRTNNIIKKNKFPCSTGEAYGIKEKEGDKKTPEGVYFFKDKYEDRYLSPVYGTKALPMDYPNFIDKKQGRNGSQIWLHGTNRKLKPMDTNGCISMNNDDILKLAQWVTIDLTPVVVVEKINWLDRKQILKEKFEIEKWLEKWIESIEKKSYHDYLSFYSPSYLPGNTWWPQWVRFRNLASVKYGSELGVVVSNKGIYRHDGVYVCLFEMGLTLGGNTIFFGKRKVFFIKNAASYAIVGDVFQHFNEGYEKAPYPIADAASRLVQKHDNDVSVSAMVKEWLLAWSDENIDRYAEFYSRDFFSDGMNKQQWISRKRMLSQRYRYIKVTGKNFTLNKSGDHMVVNFFQKYESSGFNATGTKKLILIREDEEWKIYREIWKEK